MRLLRNWFLTRILTTDLPSLLGSVWLAMLLLFFGLLKLFGVIKFNRSAEMTQPTMALGWLEQLVTAGACLGGICGSLWGALKLTSWLSNAAANTYRKKFRELYNSFEKSLGEDREATDD
jgi:transcriptional regulator GlxA family with amidase domain